MDSAKNGWWIFPFMKFGMVRVNVFECAYKNHGSSKLMESLKSVYNET